ncbi:phospholipase D-like domain-containing protein [Undibacterium sp. Di24W]|uniref:phospholipase D-like domain-containing protein n=1 Tax=Undibacterium sp. Di24W TaxID=3413033 RepID=UPI003BF084F0
MPKILYQSGNHLQLHYTGEAFFPALLSAIDQAREEIYLETYIFAHDQSSKEIEVALIKAAAREVRVQVIIDWVGSGRDASMKLQARFAQNGVSCRVFNIWFRRGLVRTHRKLCVVDRETAFIGGINIVDDLLTNDIPPRQLPFPRWDFAIQAQGSCVSTIHKELTAEWLKLGKIPLLNRLRLARELRRTTTIRGTDGSAAAVVFRDNLRHRFSIQSAYLRALGRAKTKAYFANPYFAPGRRLRNGLINAAKRGVDVRLLLGVGEFDLQDLVAQSYYPRLLMHGIRIYEYHRTQMHAKVAVIDGQWSTVGSSNFDGLSLFLNHEANILINDSVLGSKLEQHLMKGFEEAVEITADTVAKQSFFRQMKNRFAYMLYRWVLQLATLGQYR